MPDQDDAHLGELRLVSHFGTTRYRVRILGRFLWLCYIEAIQFTTLKGNRTLLPGQRAFVPQRAVRRLSRDET
ncbi:hypothetical protein THIOKS12100061 [Thiocapsa sp. KS1]|jgi:hypothetical protein|nr:hypothetical protein [Thiocapsa sp. KS1]CRI64777.1 hypothetical protein THIOKS12100061 [Thiocapsa sp. KS1]